MISLFLSLCLLGGISLSGTAAEEDHSGWGSLLNDPDSLPPPPGLDPSLPVSGGASTQAPVRLPEAQTGPVKKKGFFRKATDRLTGKHNEKPVPEERITQVGPRDTPPAPDPLLRVPVAIVLNGTRVAPGLYLIKSRPAEDGSEGRELVLWHTGRNMGTIALRKLVGEQAPPPEPVEPVREDKRSGVPQPKLPVKLFTQVAPNFQSLRIRMQDGRDWYESADIRAQPDDRPVYYKPPSDLPPDE
jgi:hypothetical protein